MKIASRMAVMALALGLSFSASAAEETFRWLVFHQTDGSETAMSVDGLTITCQDGMLTVSNSEKTESFRSLSLESMWFSNNTAGINSTDADQSATVEIYSVDGLSCGKFGSVSEAAKILPKGHVYVVKKGTSTYKICVR